MQVRIEDDLDLKKISESGQCFRWTEISPGTYQIIAQNQCLRIYGFWFNYLDLDESYESIRRRISREKDEFLFHAAEYEKGVRILRQDPWEMLITFIISQNKNIPAIRRSVEKLAELCGMEMTNGSGVRYFAFPTPDALEELQDDQLKECGLGAMTTLTGLTGVGKKVASCVALFGLHHLNSFPIDVWIKRILEEQYPEGYPFEKYSPYNGVYQQYMFDFYRNTSMFSR